MKKLIIFLVGLVVGWLIAIYQEVDENVANQLSQYK